MIIPITYPKNGVLLLSDGSKWFYGQSSDWNDKLKKHKTSYYFIPKTESCDRANANACHRRARFVGYEKENRPDWVYAIHKCPKHGNIRSRLCSADGPEVAQYLKSK